MTVYIGADHVGFHVKEELKPWIRSLGHQVVDCGNRHQDPGDDYPDFAFAVADKVVHDPDTRGIVICGSGAGVSIAANKVKGIRCALGINDRMVRASRNDDDINVLALAADFTSLHAMKEMIHMFLTVPFDSAERRVRRLGKITSRER